MVGEEKRRLGNAVSIELSLEENRVLAQLPYTIPETAVYDHTAFDEEKCGEEAKKSDASSMKSVGISGQ